MRKSKYYIKNWKRWKASLYSLKETKRDLENNIKAISYDSEMPGGNHKSIFEEYDFVLDELEKYDKHINFYETVINKLERNINVLLTNEQKQVVIIYANHPYYGDYAKREKDAIDNGFSKTAFYDNLNKAFDILDTVLELKDETLEEILKYGKNAEK